MRYHSPLTALGAMLGVALFLTGGLSSPPHAQEPAKDTGSKTVWAGVYTDAQAARGQARYQAVCSSCHDDGPRRGEAFMRDWSGSDVDMLFGRIRASMPPGAPSSLSDAEYVDIVAYILRVNAFPAGREDLTAGTIEAIRIEGRNGPEPVPNFVLVRVAGCLTQGPDAAWVLADAGEPIRTRNPAASTGEELKSAAEAAPGTGTFRLLNAYPRPDPYKGHTVEAKGFLIRDPGGDRINVTSVQTLAPECRVRR